MQANHALCLSGGKTTARLSLLSDSPFNSIFIPFTLTCQIYLAQDKTPYSSLSFLTDNTRAGLRAISHKKKCKMQANPGPCAPDHRAFSLETFFWKRRGNVPCQNKEGTWKSSGYGTIMEGYLTKESGPQFMSQTRRKFCLKAGAPQQFSITLQVPVDYREKWCPRPGSNRHVVSHSGF